MKNYDVIMNPFVIAAMEARRNPLAAILIVAVIAAVIVLLIRLRKKRK